MTPDLEHRSRHGRLLTVISLISIVVMSLHITDDIVRGISPAAPDNVGASVIFLVWLFGILVLAGRRSGYVIQILGGMFAAAMPVLHMTGKSYPAIAASSGGFFFVWSLIVVGATGALAVLLAANALRLTFGQHQRQSA